MSAIVAEKPELECAIIGALKDTIICVVPTRPVATRRGLKEGQRLHLTQFAVVNEDGLPFTTTDLKHMGLDPTNAHGIRNLCIEKLPLIFTLYFPSGIYDKVFLPGCCHVDEDGKAHILFGVSGNTKCK